MFVKPKVVLGIYNSGDLRLDTFGIQCAVIGLPLLVFLLYVFELLGVSISSLSLRVCVCVVKWLGNLATPIVPSHTHYPKAPKASSVPVFLDPPPGEETTVRFGCPLVFRMLLPEILPHI